MYDHVNWVFLLLMIRKMGLGEKWIEWIKSCIYAYKIKDKKVHLVESKTKELEE